MTIYEISLLTPDPHDTGIREYRVDANYIANEPSLSAAQKAAIFALEPEGVWTGRAVRIKRVEEPESV